MVRWVDCWRRWHGSSAAEYYTLPRNIGKELVRAAFKKLGYRINRIDSSLRPLFGLDSFFGLVQQFGFAPKWILDVGANRGTWTRTAIKYFPSARYTLVEPQDHLKIHIQDLIDAGYRIEWVNAGAGDRSESLPFLLELADRDHSSTFVFTPEQRESAGLREIVVPVRTLNEIAAQENGPPPDMVKIDAEGFDLKVLSGASDLFGKTDIFLVEVTICSTCENTFLEVARKMASVGYRLIDITDMNRSPRYGVLWLCEAAFLRNGSQLFDGIASYE